MKTIDKKPLRAHAFLWIVFLLFSFFSLPALAEIGQDPQQRFFISAGAGSFYPRQSIFRKIYNNPLWPVELQFGWTLSRRISFFSGARYLQASGNTILMVAQRPEETYALRWQMVTLKLGTNYWFWSFRFSPFLGAGVSYSFYKEQWLEVPKLTTGKKTGFFVQTGGCYRLSSRLYALAQLEYSSIPAGNGAQGKVNLGGLNLSLGLMAGIL